MFLSGHVCTHWMFVQAGGDVFDLLFPCEGRKLLCSCISFCKANDLGASRFQSFRFSGETCCIMMNLQKKQSSDVIFPSFS